jgi:murein DD-endopeptidase MepM/ murein hydrolase activator NlpD
LKVGKQRVMATENQQASAYNKEQKNADITDYLSNGFVAGLGLPGTGPDLSELWQAPVSGGVRSGYGWRINPVTHKRDFHKGEDIAAPAGTPIKAAGSGTIKTVGWTDLNGNYVFIDHGNPVPAHAPEVHTWSWR